MKISETTLKKWEQYKKNKDGKQKSKSNNKFIPRDRRQA